MFTVALELIDKELNFTVDFVNLPHSLFPLDLSCDSVTVVYRVVNCSVYRYFGSNRQGVELHCRRVNLPHSLSP